VRLSGVKPGDLIQAGHGPGLYTGRVKEVQRGWVFCVPFINPSASARRIRASDVHTHWRLMRSESRP
jgi:hypothetical protein